MHSSLVHRSHWSPVHMALVGMSLACRPLVHGLLFADFLDVGLLLAGFSCAGLL